MGPLYNDEGNLPFEAALDKAGFGLYSYILTCFTGVTIISFGCISFSRTMIIPTSACELETTTAQQGFLASVPLLGLILGAVIWGYLGDVFGRRIPLLISLLITTIVNGIASISVNWIMLIIMQFLASFLSSGQFSLALTLLSESVPMMKRNVVVLLVTSIFLLTQGIMALIAMPIIPLSFSVYLPSLDIYWNSWRTLLLVYSVPSVISAIWLYFLMESPKYFYNKGRESEALDILTRMHRLNNGRSAGEYGVLGFLDDSKRKTEGSGKPQVLNLFKMSVLKYTLIMTSLYVFQQLGSFLVWLPTILTQLFQILETGEGFNFTLCEILRISRDTEPDPDVIPCSLNNSALLVVLAIGAIQSAVNVLFSVVVNRLGRRNIVICVAFVCGASGILINLVPNAIGSVVLFAIFLIGVIVTGLYAAIAVAVFPTSLRAMAVALTTTGGRIGTFASIQLINWLLEVNCELAFYLFASIFASSGLIALLLSDDRKQLSVQQRESSGRNEASKVIM